MNPVIQLAAALDRRGMTVSIDGGDRLLVHLGGYREHILIGRQVRGIAPQDIGKSWLWEHGGKSGTHPVSDHDGAAAAIGAFLRAGPGLAGTALVRRMDKFGRRPDQHQGELGTSGTTLRGPSPAGPSVGGGQHQNEYGRAVGDWA